MWDLLIQEMVSTEVEQEYQKFSATETSIRKELEKKARKPRLATMRFDSLMAFSTGQTTKAASNTTNVPAAHTPVQNFALATPGTPTSQPVRFQAKVKVDSLQKHNRVIDEGLY